MSGLTLVYQSQQFIAFLSGLHVLVSYFHQRFWIPFIPGVDQFFLFFSMCCSFPMSTVISSSCVTLSFILLATVLHPLPFWCFCVVFPYSTPKSHESINAWNRSFVIFLIGCISEKATFFFFKHLIVTYSCVSGPCFEQFYFQHSQTLYPFLFDIY